MRIPRNLGSFAAALACINLLMPLHLLHASGPQTAATRSTGQTASAPTLSKTARPMTRDVSLGGASEIHGQLVDKNGAPLANRVVVAVHTDKSSLQTVSDANGLFRLRDAKPGLYQIASERSYQLCRCWADGTAPPSSSKQLLMVEGDQTIRGQRPFGELLSGPVLIALIIAAAIIIPIAIHNNNKTAS